MHNAPNHSGSPPGSPTSRPYPADTIAASLATLPAGLRHSGELLWCELLGKRLAWLAAHSEYRPTPYEHFAYAGLAARLLAGEPLAYLLGHMDFYSLHLLVHNQVLIPRPETELLVDAVLELPLPDNALVLDFGCGSGAIACALASHRPGWRVLAADTSAPALRLAATNAARLGQSHRVCCLHSNWWCGLEGLRPDAVVTNPPYVAVGDARLAGQVANWEPHTALFAGTDGLDAYRQIVAGLPGGTWLAGEHGADQAEPLALLLAAGGLEVTSQAKDLAGLPRLVVARSR